MSIKPVPKLGVMVNTNGGSLMRMVSLGSQRAWHMVGDDCLGVSAPVAVDAAVALQVSITADGRRHPTHTSAYACTALSTHACSTAEPHQVEQPPK